MRYFLTLLTLTFFGCSEQAFTKKDHETIKLGMISSYHRHKSEFQALASQVGSFKYIRSIDFKYGRDGQQGINVYCDSIDRNAAGESFTIKNLSDPRFQHVLKEEGVSQAMVENIQNRLDRLHCNSFFTLRQPSSDTGIPYVHIELQYNDWNGANFYFYKLFDKKMEPEMVNFFNRENTSMGNLKGIRGVLDSNTIWYLKRD